ncbi:UNVERIFIED_CONTAM: hypothetical protein RF648_18750, partial [Kocuria sp. CPCC 205274]
MGFTIGELSRAAGIATDLVENIVNQHRYPSEDSKLPLIIKTVDKRNDETVYIHISQMANYTFQRKVRMTKENPDYGLGSTSIEDVVHDEVYYKAMEEDTNA